jgi:peptidoglycan/LPS O-acetylase OafA/YrhL
MNSSSSKPMSYRADIDGLRAVAVLAVLFFHADLGLPGGFVGVDVFFVISGYLITGLILKDLNGGHFRMFDFWERRIRRILPVLTVVTLTSLIAAWFLFLPGDFKSCGRSMMAQVVLGANVNFWLDADYFAQAAELKPLLHTWSLAVEEQFYLSFPFLLLAIHRVSRAAIVPVTLALCFVSFALSVYCSYRHEAANFYLLPMRAWELLIGSFLAAIPARKEAKRWVTESLSWSGLLAILCAVAFFNRETRFPGVAAVLPVVGAAVLIWTNSDRQTLVGKLLSTRPVVFIGLISYSLYLWHWPALVFWKYLSIDPIPKSENALLLVASLILAVLSWKFVETPFRKRSILSSRVQVFSFAIISSAILLLAGLAIYRSEGLPSRLDAEVLRYSNGSVADFKFVEKMSYQVGLKEIQAGDLVELGSGDKRKPVEVLLWGDSHAAALVPIVNSLCRKYSIRGVAAMYAATAPLVGYESESSALKEDCIVYSDSVIEFIRSNHIGNVLLAAKWGGYVDDSGTERIRSALVQTIGALKEVNPRIYVVRQVPKPRLDVPRALAIALIQGRDLNRVGVPSAAYWKEFQRQNPCFLGLSSEYPSVNILDPSELFLGSAGICRFEQGGKALYCDASHLSAAGAGVLEPLFEPIFVEVGKR